MRRAKSVTHRIVWHIIDNPKISNYKIANDLGLLKKKHGKSQVNVVLSRLRKRGIIKQTTSGLGRRKTSNEINIEYCISVFRGIFYRSSECFREELMEIIKDQAPHGTLQATPKAESARARESVSKIIRQDIFQKRILKTKNINENIVFGLKRYLALIDIMNGHYLTKSGKSRGEKLDKNNRTVQENEFFRRMLDIPVDDVGRLLNKREALGNYYIDRLPAHFEKSDFGYINYREKARSILNLQKNSDFMTFFLLIHPNSSPFVVGLNKPLTEIKKTYYITRSDIEVNIVKNKGILSRFDNEELLKALLKWEMTSKDLTEYFNKEIDMYIRNAKYLNTFRKELNKLIKQRKYQKANQLIERNKRLDKIFGYQW